MMGRQHAMTGVLAGVVLGQVAPAVPGPIQALVVVVTGGASLLPDLDHPQATAARSLGLVTRLLAIGMDRLAMTIYHATRGPRDTQDRRSGHRAFTHTLPACALAGGLSWLLMLVWPLIFAVVAALLGGLLALGLKQAGGWLAIATGVGAAVTLFQYPGWSWLFPVAVTVGCVVHVMGDWLTNSGVPLAWPLQINGRRWGAVRSPIPFDAGGAEERMLVAPVLLGGVVVSVAWSTGLLNAVWSAYAGMGS
jgi:membrane-bound metal-dependent hydrolase YbcI (DUF457 family)